MKIIDKKFLGIISIIAINIWQLYAQENRSFPGTTHYDLEIKIDYNSGKLAANGTITLVNRTTQPVNQIHILLYRLLKVRSVMVEGIKVIYDQSIVSVDGWKKLQVNLVKIKLNEALQVGEEIKLEMSYDGFLCGYSEAGWNYVKDHIDKSFTIIRTDGFGYPVVGYPNDRDMMAITKEIYDYQLKITVPAGLTVATGGLLLNQSTIDGMTTFMFRSKRPSWRIDIVISDYKILSKDQNRLYFFNQDSARAPGLYTAMLKAHDIYTGWFGKIEGYQGYSIIEVPEGYGSQSDVAAMLITADNFRQDAQFVTVYHELSHLWNVRNLESKPCRIESEGLAQFLQFLLLEKLDLKENAIKDAANRYLNQMVSILAKNIEVQTIPIKEYGVYDITDYSYRLGMVFFALYYDLIGHEVFVDIIKTYYNKYYQTGATFEDFILHCQAKTPINLQPFLSDWFQTTKVLELIKEGKNYDDFIQRYR
jgi:hypothetical protein